MVFHITSVHTRYDTRVFSKECISLKNAGFDVSLIVCDGKGDEIQKGIKIIDAGNCRNFGRLKRMWYGPKFINSKLKHMNLQDSVIHFHDPELLPLSYRLQKKGCKVVYDSHENVPNQILSKPYLNKFVARCVSVIFKCVEKKCVKKASAIISVTDENVGRLSKYNSNAFLVRNYPVLSSFEEIDFSKKELNFIYAGGITEIRSANEISLSAKQTKTPVSFYGPLESEELGKKIKNEYISLKGNVPQKELFDINCKSSVGFILFYKVPNHMVCSPNKLFEYMASGMAVIASDIPMWKEIIEKYECGICVDPQNVDQICSAIEYMKANPSEVRRMGENGRKAVLENFSWENESKVLLSCYEKIMGMQAHV